MRFPYLRSLPAALAVLCACASPETPVSNPVLTKLDADKGVIHNGEADSPVMATFGEVKVYASGYGSAVAFAPRGSRDFCLLTDRGPNIDFPGGNKAFPVPSYTPRIIKSHLAGDKPQVDGEILFRRADGTLMTGLPIGAGGCGGTGELAFTLGGASAGSDPEGIDSEGRVVLDDASFWVSDEYGLFLAARPWNRLPWRS